MKVIKKSNIRYVACIFIVLFLASFVFGDSQYGSNTSNVDIPDTGDWVYSSINISGAPADAVVTGIDVHFSCIHTWSGDLNIDLNDQDISRNYDLWENEGGSADNPSRTVYGISTFNGLPVNQTWYLFAQDTTGGDTGYIDEWWITIYYESKSYAVYSKIDSLSYGTDADGDGYYETFNFYIGVDADVTPGSADIYARIICNTTGQAWWSTNPWTITGTETDYHYFYMDETYFSGYISGNTDLDFTVEIWDSTKSSLLATDTSVYGEPVKADYYIPPTYAVYSNIYNLVYGQDADGDGYYETYDFYIAIDADVSSGSSSIYARMICNTTEQAWWSADPWTITGTETDYHYFSLDETYFSGISGNTDLDFTVEIWDSSKSTLLATDTTVTGEPVKADYVDLTQTRFVGNDFVDKTAKIGIPILLKARLQYYSWLVWWDFSGQTAHFDIYYSGSWHEIPDDGISETSFVTDANGYASVYYTPPKSLSPGNYSIRARYDGSGTYAPYELTRTLTIKKPNWLVMIYMCGDNNLDYEYSRIFYEDIAISGNNDEVSIVLFFDRSDSPTYEPTWTTGRYYKVCKDNVVIHNDWGEVNMGSTATFNQFIELATLECSAYNRTILFKNHGSGVVQKPIEQEVSPIKPNIKDLFQDKAPPELINIQKINSEEEGSIQGVIFDDDPIDHLTLSEVRSVIGGYGNFGLIGYDACLMGMVEVVYDLKDYANYVVATEESNYTTSWKFVDMFSVSNLTNSTTAEQFADSIVQLSVQPTNGSWYLSTTNTANINSEISSFADRMIELLPFSQSIRDNILNALIASRSFYDSNYIDLRQFALDIASSTTDSTLQLRANTVTNRLANSTWRTSWKTTYEDTLGGLSIFFPPFKGGTKWDSYFSPNWCLFTSNSDQHWDEFLQLYFDDDNPNCSIFAPNYGGWYKGDILVVATASDSTSDILYVEFQYSVNGSNWYPLPGPDSPDGKDWYSPNGWALTFRTTSTPSHGTINDGTVWVKSRSMDKAGNLSNWDVCDYAFGVDNSPPDLSGSFANTADPLPGTYSTLQSIVDSLSGVLDNTVYPRFYFRWNNNTIDSTHYDIVAVGSWNGSFYEANINVTEDNIGDRIFWRVLGSDNVDNFNWSPVHDGGVIQSINFVTDTDSISVPEGGNATFQVKLSREPASTVNAFVAWVSGDADITVQSGSNLTFTTSNWNTYQTVTLAAAEDGDTVNSSATFRITALGIPDKPITAIESDNDTVNFETNTNSVTVPEGSTGTFQVRLTDSPTSTVNASVSWVSGDSDITVQSGSSLTFTTSNWNTYQTVTLAASEDVDIANGSAAIRISASGIPDKDITANEQDNDLLGFVTNTDSVTVAEGSTATFQVKLSHQPTSNISVFVTNVSGDSDITVQSGSSLTFTTSNWNTYQTVTLAALEDGDIANGSATIRISASGIPDKEMTATEQDNDTINFVTDPDSVTVPEGSTASFQVRLSDQPSSDVYASVSWFSGDSDIAVQSGSSLTFTSSNWNTYQTVTIFASEDVDVVNGSATIRLTASEVTDKDITAVEADNDTLSFETDTELVTVPEGSTTTFQVRLSHQPSSDVNASVSWVGGDSDITVQSGSNLTFTSSNWNTYQTVTLAAAEDADETNDQATIRISAAGVPDKDITATEQDNDTEGISGRVIDSQGNGIQNVWVYVYDLNGYYISEDSTDSSGNYSVQVSAGSYKIFFDTWNAGNYFEEWYNDKGDFDSADPVMVTAGQITTLDDAVLADGAIISGQVTDSQGNGIEDVYIEVYDLNYYYLRGGSTDSNGNYTIQGLPAGNCKVFFGAYNTGNYVDEWYNDKGSFYDADPVSVTTGQTTVVDAVLAEGGMIGGRVTDSQGSGIADVYIEVRSLSNSYLGYGYTDSNGDYLAQRLPAGDCKVYFDAYSAGNYISEWYNDKDSFENADAVSVTAGQTTTLEDAVLAESGMISGRVTDSQGNGIENVDVRLYDLNYNLMYTGSTDSSGNYNIGTVLPGSYKVYFLPPGLYSPSWYSGQGSFETAAVVNVISGQVTSGIDEQLTSITPVEIMINDPATQAEINPAGENDWFYFTVTTQGRYTIQTYLGTLNDSYIYLYGPDDPSLYIDKDDDGGQGLASKMTQTLNPGTYYVKARAFNSNQVGTYSIRVFQSYDSITGRVIDVFGNELQDVWVNVYDLNNDRVVDVFTDSNGSYTVTDLDTGDYKTYFDTTNAGNYAPEWYNDKGSFDDADVVSVTSGQTTGLADAVLAEGGIISGRVTDGTNGIENVRVRVYDLDYSAVGSSVYTDSNGDYTVQCLAGGSYKVRFYTTGNFIGEWYNDRGDFYTADVVPVTEGQTTTLADTVLAVGGIISGRVTDSQGNGIVDVEVYVYDLNGDYLSWGYSDSNGDYAVQAIPAGNCKVEFYPYYYGNYIAEWYNDKGDFSTADEVTVTSGNTTSGIDAVLMEGGGISGHVTDSQGNSIENVYVYIYDLNYNYLRNVYTNSSGDYTIQALPGGNYKVYFRGYTAGNYLSEWYNDKDSFDNADMVLVTDGQTTTLTDAVLADGGSINGRVSDNGDRAIEGVTVHAYDMDYHFINSTYTDSNGDYTIQAVPTGNCKVRFSTTGNYIGEWYNDKSDFDNADPVFITAGQTTTGVDAILELGGSITGTVTDTLSNPVADLDIGVYDLYGNYLTWGYTDENGNYEVHGIPGGSYKVLFDPWYLNNYPQYYGDHNYAHEWYNDKGTFNDADIVPVSVNQVTPGIDAVLSEGGTITGEITDEYANAVENVTIIVLKDNTQNLMYYYRGESDSNGVYEVKGLPTGDYLVIFRASQGYSGQFYNDVLFESDATLVSVTLGSETSGINAVLKKAAVVSGRVTDANGNGIEDVIVRFYDSVRNEYLGWIGNYALTDNDGYYTIASAAPGERKVMFETSSVEGGNVVSEFYNDKQGINNADILTIQSEGTYPDINAVLSFGGGTLSGYVKNSSGIALEGVNVEIYNTQYQTVMGGTGTDSNGYFEIKGLIPGQYKVFTSLYHIYTSEWYSDKTTFEAADTVTVTDGGNTQIHVLLGGSDPGSINITSPNGGESLVIGSRHEITWDSTETGSVIIAYSTNGGASWNTIVPLTPNDGSYYWTVPDTPSENCLIRISGSDSDEAPSDISDTVFSIVSSLPSAITVTSPNGGESLIAGSTHNITWTFTGPNDIENVIIEYSTNSGVSWENIVPSTANTGNHNWIVPANPSENCLIRISGSDSDLGPSDVNDTEFSIVLPTSATVTVTSPNGGEKLDVGSIYNIIWTSTGTDDIDNIKIEYSIDSGTSWSEIVTSTANNGSYSWTVLDNPSDNCLIRISDTDGDPSDISDAVFSIVLPPSITITSPNGGESWETGSTQSITWTINGTNSVGNLKIEYSTDNGSSWIDIDTSAANTGSCDWIVPDNPSDNCLVRLSGSDADRTISDISDGIFSIVPASFITVTSPNGGESLEVGSIFDITWTSSGTQGEVKIDYSTDNGVVWTTIVTSTADDGSHSWTVPDDPSDNCLVRISETEGEPSDVSDAVFFIVSPTTVTVTSPNGGESLTVGSKYEITWTSTGMGENDDVIIEYSADNDATWINIVPSTANNGRYIWTVPDNPSDNCLIRIRVDDSDDGPADVSDALFSIVPAPFITVTSPNGGESLNVDSTHEITWTTTGTDDVENITIEYSTDSGTSWTNIVVSTENDGSYEWTIPDDPSENCLVRVSGGDSDEGPSDVSNEVFSIIPIPIITVKSPNGGEQWITGSTYNITWTSSNVTGDINIYLYEGESFDLNIGTASVDSGTFEWTIPGTFTVGDDYKVLVFQDSIEDYSDECFSIIEKGPNNPDFNNDGKVDILWRNYVTGANEVWYMDEATHIGTASLLVMADLYWRIVGTGDFNQDGKVDILWRRYTDGKNLVWTMDGVTRTGEAYLLDLQDSNWKIVGTGDFNGDAKVDIVWRNALEGRNMVWYMDGVTRIGIKALPKIEGESWEIAGTGDFNGDHKVDILWRNYGNGSNQVWYMDGVTRIGTADLIQETDLDWRIVGTGDFNLDGAIDILWRRYSDGQNMIWYMSGVVRIGYESIETRSDLNWRIVNNGD